MVHLLVFVSSATQALSSSSYFILCLPTEGDVKTISAGILAFSSLATSTAHGRRQQAPHSRQSGNFDCPIPKFLFPMMPPFLWLQELHVTFPISLYKYHYSMIFYRLFYTFINYFILIFFFFLYIIYVCNLVTL